MDALAKLFFGSNRLAKLSAWAWLFSSPLKIVAKRRAIQRARKVSDGDILPLLSGAYFDDGRIGNLPIRTYEMLVGLPLG